MQLFTGRTDRFWCKVVGSTFRATGGINEQLEISSRVRFVGRQIKEANKSRDGKEKGRAIKLDNCEEMKDG